MNGWEIALFAAVAIVLLCQSNWLFADARKHSRIPWFWGLWGLINFPLPLILYWLIVRRAWPFGRGRSRTDGDAGERSGRSG
ncbi:sigmaY antisigma factor component [Paenibacillus sp. MWE-103]|uniref:SigmaY antisigma factor component n=1 Tax=Paenibacillus artemisiicola TaxID=1172618 RepID=A0ABS3WIB1_9BACL|nr:sigmaY antisigma factor component [Paenibacillus artemisiicola]MBO7747865.1 sigmaY antisigma factor component [Paenibacillus artemisiicola]